MSEGFETKKDCLLKRVSALDALAGVNNESAYEHIILDKSSEGLEHRISILETMFEDISRRVTAVEVSHQLQNRHPFHETSFLTEAVPNPLSSVHAPCRMKSLNFRSAVEAEEGLIIKRRSPISPLRHDKSLRATGLLQASISPLQLLVKLGFVDQHTLFVFEYIWLSRFGVGLAAAGTLLSTSACLFPYFLVPDLVKAFGVTVTHVITALSATCFGLHTATIWGARRFMYSDALRACLSYLTTCCDTPLGDRHLQGWLSTHVLSTIGFALGCMLLNWSLKSDIGYLMGSCTFVFVTFGLILAPSFGLAYNLIMTCFETAILTPAIEMKNMIRLSTPMGGFKPPSHVPNLGPNCAEIFPDGSLDSFWTEALAQFQEREVMVAHLCNAATGMYVPYFLNCFALVLMGAFSAVMTLRKIRDHYTCFALCSVASAFTSAIGIWRVACLTAITDSWTGGCTYKATPSVKTLAYSMLTKHKMSRSERDDLVLLTDYMSKSHVGARIVVLFDSRMYLALKVLFSAFIALLVRLLAAANLD